jgi:hypothetical protein
MRFIFFLAFIFNASLSHAFDANVSRSELTRYKRGFLIGDLVVGDQAYVNAWDFCFQSGNLFLIKNTAIRLKSEYSINLLIDVQPQNFVTVTLVPRKEKEDFSDDLDKINIIIPSHENCKFFEERYFPDKIEYFGVKSIDGYSNMRDYLNYLFELGFKAKATID